MKTIRKVIIEPVFIEEFIPDVLEPNKVYISEQYKCAVHSCLCGCGEKTIMPLSEKYGWSLIKNDGKVSFTPSIGNYNFECKSHYVITNNIANFI
jgi:hypothetical protein